MRMPIGMTLLLRHVFRKSVRHCVFTYLVRIFLASLYNGNFCCASSSGLLFDGGVSDSLSNLRRLFESEVTTVLMELEADAIAKLLNELPMLWSLPMLLGLTVGVAAELVQTLRVEVFIVVFDCGGTLGATLCC